MNINIKIFLYFGLFLISPSFATADISSTHGMNIPSTHPRIWYNASRLDQAQNWYSLNQFTPNEWRGLQWASYALRGLLNNEFNQCEIAVNWAVSFVPGSTSPFRDDMRWYGQDIALIYDWCYSSFTSEQREVLILNWNEYFEEQMNYSWAGIGGIADDRGGPMGNYYWGVIGNLLLWSIATYEENTIKAEIFLNNALNARISDEWSLAAATTGKGGVGPDSSHYGQMLRLYSIIPFESAKLLGRDIYAESNYWKEAVYYIIYSTPPIQSNNNGESSWDYFSFGDDEFWNTTSSNGGNQAKLSTFGDFMTTMASRWAETNTGGFASKWLANISPAVTEHIKSVTPSLPNPLSFSSLPLDYYAAGPSYLFGHSNNNWESGTIFGLNIGFGTVLGHVHDDYGHWQLWRGGRWISRETTEYAKTIKGYDNNLDVGINTTYAHNGLLINGMGLSTSEQHKRNGVPIVNRLESRDNYLFTSIDITDAYHNDINDEYKPERNNSAVKHIERDYIFIRDLEILIIFDRLESDIAGRTKTFLAHCQNSWVSIDDHNKNCIDGTQSMLLTTLIPNNPNYRVVIEGDNFGQYRLEVDDSPQTTQSYFLHVLQAKSLSSSALNPSVTDNGSYYHVVLDGTHSLNLNKGMMSTGGSITLSGTTVPFINNVQTMIVTDNGPVWNDNIIDQIPPSSPTGLSVI